MHTGEIAELLDMGIGTRVEIDFVDVLSMEEGLLVGDTGRGFLCVLAENRATDTYPARPFRVNAGAIHQYVYIGDNKTKYLSEIRPGDRLPVTDGENIRYVAVGRIKQEKRPFQRITLNTGISATLQIADSVFIKTGIGEAGHFVDLKEGQSILCKVEKLVARHKGELLDEEIYEA